MIDVEQISLLREELEALRLCDVDDPQALVFE